MGGTDSEGRAILAGDAGGGRDAGIGMVGTCNWE